MCTSFAKKNTGVQIFTLKIINLVPYNYLTLSPMKKIYTLILFASLIFPAFAQWSEDAANNIVIADLSGEQVIPKIGICQDSTLYIGFFSNQTGNYNVRLQKLDSDGNKLWDDNGILVFDGPTDSWVSDWGMATDKYEHAILTFTWTSNDSWNIKGYRVSPEGELVWGDDGIDITNNTAFNAAPKVMCTAAGNSVFAWMADDFIVMQKVSPEGVKLWGDDGITIATAERTAWPQFLPVGEDEFIMKYYEDSGPSWAPTRHLVAQRFDSDGQGVWSAPAIVSNAGGITAWTQILSFISDGNEGFYVAWHDDRNNDQMVEAFVQHVDSDGNPTMTANGVSLSTMGSHHHFTPFLALPEGSGNIYAYWSETDDLQNYRGIYGQSVSSSGERMWTDAGKVIIPLMYPDVVTPWDADVSGADMVLLYDEGNSAAQEIKMIKLNKDGNFVWPSEYTTISSANSTKVHMDMSRFAYDQWILSWEDNRKDASDIYAQNINNDGSLGVSNIAVKYKETRKLSVYPNPVSVKGVVNLSISNQFSGTLVINDIYGREISKLAVAKGTNEIPVSALLNDSRDGLYMLNYITDTERYSCKLLIEK